jgi:hypothetical protein
MLHWKTLGTVALLGLLIGTAASADDHRYDRDGYRDYDRGYYRSEPQIRFGVDVIWGGYGYAPPRPPVYWYPSRYQANRYYDPGYRRGNWRGEGRGHRKHDHRSHRGDDCDD